jgi:hypothetical protein
MGQGHTQNPRHNDGGHHLRRDFVMPPVTPIGEQLPPRG